MAMGAVIVAIDIVERRYSKFKSMSMGAGYWGSVLVVGLGGIMEPVLVLSGFRFLRPANTKW